MVSASVGSTGIYQHMYQTGNCVQLAGLYLQWSFELEQAENFPKAGQILRDGIANNARPVEKLKEAYRCGFKENSVLEVIGFYL